MIQEYLFEDIQLKDSIDTSDVSIFRNTIIKKKNVSDTDCWILEISTLGDNKNSAKVLSEIHQYITKKYNVDILTNGSSTYFCRKLFPLINQFEFQLRKLLYLSSMLVKEHIDRNIIKDIEKLDFGKIFEMLFIDSSFVSEAKNTIKNKNWLFTKKELVDKINSLGEVTMWDQLKYSDIVSELKDNYILVKKYRNDVMHAHTIDYNSFDKAKKLFTKINNQLNVAIGKLLGENNTDSDKIAMLSFVDILNEYVNKYIYTMDDGNYDKTISLFTSIILQELQNDIERNEIYKEKAPIKMSSVLSKMYGQDYDKIISDVKTGEVKYHRLKPINKVVE